MNLAAALTWLRGEAARPRREFIYSTGDGSVAALRHGNWKLAVRKAGAEGVEVQHFAGAVASYA